MPLLAIRARLVEAAGVIRLPMPLLAIRARPVEAAGVIRLA
ncbi:MAG TPA: hypothetical protein VGY32_10865 [Solirubrobacteraceae bacterium]|nr:hypothetical protein [Solirubrobacteraceae bacterium]